MFLLFTAHFFACNALIFRQLWVNNNFVSIVYIVYRKSYWLENQLVMGKQYCLREIFSEQDFSPEQLKNHLEDFVLNLEVIEDRFFKKQN